MKRALVIPELDRDIRELHAPLEWRWRLQRKRAQLQAKPTKRRVMRIRTGPNAAAMKLLPVVWI